MKLRWTRRALGDLQHLADRTALDKPMAAAAFVEALMGKAVLLEQQPLLGRTGSLDDSRELVVHKDHLLTCCLRGHEVQVLQVWHVARQGSAGKP